MLTTQVVMAGTIEGEPAIAWIPRGDTAVLTMTVLVSNDREDNGHRITAPPTRHRVKVFGALAEHAHDTLHDGDRVLVVGTQTAEQRYDRVKRENYTLTWVHAVDLGPSLHQDQRAVAARPAQRHLAAA